MDYFDRNGLPIKEGFYLTKKGLAYYSGKTKGQFEFEKDNKSYLISSQEFQSFSRSGFPSGSEDIVETTLKRANFIKKMLRTNQNKNLSKIYPDWPIYAGETACAE